MSATGEHGGVALRQLGRGNLDRVANVTVWLAGRPAFYAASAGYVLLLLGLKLVLTQSASEDIAEQLYLAQSWEPAYKPTQPPLFTWLTQVVFIAAGPSLAAVEAIRFALLWALSVLLFEVGRVVAGPATAARELAVACGLIPVMTYLVGWDSLFNYTNSLLMLTLAAGAVLAWTRLVVRGGRGALAALVLTAAGGLLAKYAVAPLLAAAWLLPWGASPWSIRRRGLSGLALVLLLTPVLTGVLVAEAGLEQVDGAGVVGEPGLAALWQAVPEVAVSMLSAWAPFVVVAGGLALFVVWRHGRPSPSLSRRRLAHLALLAIGLLALVAAAAALVLGVTSFKNHWFLVALPTLAVLLTPLYDEPAPETPRRLFEAAGYALAAVLPVALIVTAVVKPLSCESCENFVHYDDLAAQMRDAGFAGGTVLAFDFPDQVGGNLRPYFPDSRIVSSRRFVYAPPPRPEGEARGCALVWLEDGVSYELDYEQHMRIVLGARMDGTVPDGAAVHRFDVPVGPLGNRTLAFRFWAFDRPLGRCR